MKGVLVACSLYLAIFLGGCTQVASLRPLYTAEEAKSPYYDKRVEGEWTLFVLDGSDPAKPTCRVEIMKSFGGESSYIVQFRCPSSAENIGEQNWESGVHLVPIAGKTFFDGRATHFSDKATNVDIFGLSMVGVFPGHLLGQVWVQEDFVRFALLSDDWVESNWPNDALEHVTLDQADQIDIVTNNTAGLRDLLSKNAGSHDAFRLGMYLCRAGTDCEARAYEDELTRLPDDPWTLDMTASFLARRGDVTRAISLEKHEVEVDLDKQGQYNLGRFLLLNRDFEGARRALAQAKEPGQTPSIKTLAVLSYFLQGDYAGTIEAAKSMKDSQHQKSDDPSIDDYFARNWHFADPILLRYFALCRLGRAKEAESYLSSQAAASRLEPTEQVLLLEVLGRTTTRVPSEDLNRSVYYSALNDLRKGDRQRGRDQLVDLTRRLRKDDIIQLAAQVEIDRLAGSSQ